MAEEVTGKQLRYTYSDQNRAGDHRYISDLAKFKSHYPE
jgi:CDP-paratose 2-epimerase